MRLYLDTKDLINLLEHSEPIPPGRLAELLSKAKSQLAISFATIAEISAPLLYPSAKTNVMAVLEELGHIPLAFIADARIQCMELREAVAAYRENREYQPINPYVKRFDATIAVAGDAPTASFMSYSLAETVWDLWTHDPGLFDGFYRKRKRYEELMNEDRRKINPPPLRELFPIVVKNDLDRYSIDYEGVGMQAFGDWVWDSARRCPAKRLGFEIWHRVRANKTDQLAASDLMDFNHLYSLPYVDAFTADRRIRGYLTQVLTPTPVAPSVTILPSASDAIRLLLERGLAC